MEPEVIMQKVAKASGANYSFHKETSSRFLDSGPQGPVVCLFACVPRWEDNHVGQILARLWFSCTLQAVSCIKHSYTSQGSVYQKTNAMSEIRKTNKDTFWAQAEVRPCEFC